MSKRGQISHRTRSNQVNDFSNLLLPDGITPTDIDGAIEVKDKLFMFFELKHMGAPCRTGQRWFIERTTDAIQASGRTAISFIADHETDPFEDIQAECAIVREYRFNFKWHEPIKTITLGDAINTMYRKEFCKPL